ncbi:hypothetical protein GCM10008924_20870 [Gracilibacillus halotolerans]
MQVFFAQMLTYTLWVKAKYFARHWHYYNIRLWDYNNTPVQSLLEATVSLLLYSSHFLEVVPHSY